MDIVLYVYLSIAVVVFVIGVVVNWNIFLEEACFLYDHLNSDLWGSDLFESKIYLFFAFIGAAIGLLVVFAFRSLGWIFFIRGSIRHFLNEIAAGKQQS